MVPTVMVDARQVTVLVPGDADRVVPFDALPRLTQVLRDLADAHTVNGRLVVVPDPDVPHGHMVAVMDAARAPGFDRVVVAGGAW